MGKSIETLRKLGRISKDSNWKEKLDYRKRNKYWLNKSADIALSVLDSLDDLGKDKQWLAGKLGVGLGFVNDMVKGRTDLSLSTICALEQILNIEIIPGD